MIRKWLVSGAAGFIGSNLGRYLPSHGQLVTGFGNFLTGKSSNIERLQETYPKTFTFERIDVCDSKKVGSLCEVPAPSGSLWSRGAAKSRPKIAYQG